MALTLTITDNANGTATATISGSAGNTTQVRYWNVGGDLGSAGEGSIGGARAGDGTILMTLPKGYYWFVVVEIVGLAPLLIGNFVYQNITDGDDAIPEQCLQAVKSRIQSLTLTGISGSSIDIQIIPDIQSLQGDEGVASRLPGILLSGFANEKISGGTNTRDDYGYPVTVMIAAKKGADLEAQRPVFLKWRQQCLLAFNSQRLPGVDEIHQTTIDPQPVVNAGAWKGGLVFSAFTLMFYARMPRGLTT